MSGHKLSSSTTPMELDAFIDTIERTLETRFNWKRLLLVHVPIYSTENTSSKPTFVITSILHDFKRIPQKSWCQQIFTIQHPYMMLH